MDYVRKFLEKITLHAAANATALILLPLTPAYSQPKTAPTEATSVLAVEKPAEQSNSEDIDYGPYMADIQRRIKAAWRPPKELKTNRVIVIFNIRKDGGVSDLHLDKSSGVATQDTAALAAVKKAAPLSPLPAGAPADVDIQFTFDYNVIDDWRVVEDQTRAINVNPKNALAYRLRGDAYSELGQEQNAAEDYSKAISLNPKDAIPYRARWYVYSKLGQYQKVIEDCNKAINLDPKDVAAYLARGITYFNLEQYNKALIDINKTISLDPKNAMAYRIRSCCYIAPNEFKKAIMNYKKALALDPNNLDVTSDWGGTCRLNQLNPRDNKQAIVDISKLIRDVPNSGSAHYIRGLLYRQCSQKWKAIADFNDAITLNPFLWEAYGRRGETFSDLGQHDRAAADLTMAINQSPQEAELYAKRGTEYAKLGKYQLAIDDFKKAFKLDPDGAGYHGHYGQFTSWASDNRRYFFIDKSGKRINKQIFRAANRFSEGLAAVQASNAYGYIDISGRFVIKPQYSVASDFHEGLALIAHSNLKDHSYIDHGYINKSGKLIINSYKYPFLFTGIYDHFSEGLAPVLIGSKYGFINKRSEITIAPTFDTVRPFSEGLAAAVMAGRYGFVDKTGNFVIGPQFDLAGDFSQGLAPALQIGQSRFIKRPQLNKENLVSEISLLESVLDNCKYGFVDKNGKYVIEPRLELPPQLKHHLESSLQNTFDRDGQPVYAIYLESNFFSNDVGFSEGLAPVYVDGKYGFIDTSGTMIIQPQFVHAVSFCEGLAPVRLGNRYGFIDKTGKFVIKPQFDSAQQFSEGLAVVQMQNSKKKTPD